MVTGWVGGTAGQVIENSLEIVILSLGKDGALAAQNGKVVQVSNPLVAAKSALGSGDSMLAGLVHGFVQGFDLQQAVKSASRSSTLIRARVGLLFQASCLTHMGRSKWSQSN
jgi:fructose-1-phosphate kinase PfkB-like protein